MTNQQHPITPMTDQQHPNQMNINGYEIKPGADLEGVSLAGADLRSVNLEGARATLSTTWWLTSVDLEGANVKGTIEALASLEAAGPGEFIPFCEEGK
jgi:uncharacterized protein YjbI with pentapeptide repeats